MLQSSLRAAKPVSMLLLCSVKHLFWALVCRDRLPAGLAPGRTMRRTTRWWTVTKKRRKMLAVAARARTMRTECEI